MRYILTALALIVILCCLSVAVQAQPPGYRMECNGNSCRLVPIGPTVQTQTTTVTTPPSYAVQSPYSVYQSAPVYYSTPVWSAPVYQPVYAAPPPRRYVETYRGPFGGTWQRAYQSGGSCGNPYCGCGNCRCVNCACGY